MNVRRNGRSASPSGLVGLALVCTVVAGLLSACGPSGRSDMPPGWSEDVSPEERASLRVVVFCDHEEEGLRILDLLREAGYTHEGNYVHPTPNRAFNIKWGRGGASEDAVGEIAAIVESQVKQPLERLPIFEPGDKDVFVNLPLGRGAAEGAPVPPSLQPEDKQKGN